MRVGDLVRRPGITLESREGFASLDDALFRGYFWHRELRRGLTVHASDVFEEAGFTALSSQHEGLSCIFFLDGDVDVEIGEQGFHFRGDGRLREGLLLPSVRPESFKRCSPGRQRIRHLVVSATPEWLDRDGLASVDDRSAINAALRAHLDARSWQTGRRLAYLVERILQLGGSPSGLDQLLVESAAVEIVAEALTSATGRDAALPGKPLNLSSRDSTRLRRAHDFIHANLNMWPSVEAIAREAGMSPSSLQRLFRTAYGISVVEQIRRAKLEFARDALAAGEYTIKEAAFMSGYSSAANFATAFKRHFGGPPSDVARVRPNLRTHNT
ncbi:Exoenzyme S synthesis regulatory protein ExsA [Nitratireductor thuwali]|uniref:Exoenzyme S synthesis regulatory protein ExsA n=2 Tax=Nitratireductor thuwali TaxID=2267699 RepID=A0ABY5MNT9_9HYPH|nr:Exoenzyme S synthesis regulatory protein ExsA [Nitratireductor thuwali]